MSRGTRIAGVMATTVVMMMATAAGISAVNFTVSATSGSSTPADTSLLAVADTAPVSLPEAGALTFLEPLPTAPLPRISAKRIVAPAEQAAKATAGTPAAAATRSASAAPVAPTTAAGDDEYEGEHEAENEGEEQSESDESDD